MSIFPDLDRQLVAIRATLAAMKDAFMSALDDLKTSLRSYVTKVDVYVAAQEAFARTVEEAVAAAIKADDAEEEVDLTALAAEIAAAADKVPPKPAAPTV